MTEPSGVSSPVEQSAQAADIPVGSDTASEPTVSEPTVPVTAPQNEARPAAADTQRTDRPILWLRRSDQLFVGALVVVTIILLLVHWVRLSRWGTRPIEIDRLTSQTFEYQIDINSATWVEFAQLEGIGDVLAQGIVEDRKVNGPFRSVDDLSRVKGIGDKKLAAIREWLVVQPMESDTNHQDTKAPSNNADR